MIEIWIQITHKQSFNHSFKLTLHKNNYCLWFHRHLFLFLIIFPIVSPYLVMEYNYYDDSNRRTIWPLLHHLSTTPLIFLNVYYKLLFGSLDINSFQDIYPFLKKKIHGFILFIIYFPESEFVLGDFSGNLLMSKFFPMIVSINVEETFQQELEIKCLWRKLEKEFKERYSLVR